MHDGYALAKVTPASLNSKEHRIWLALLHVLFLSSSILQGLEEPARRLFRVGVGSY